MKIKHIRTYHKDLGNSRPYQIAYKTVDQVVNAFVEIELENGMVGIGSANPSKLVVGESVDDVISALTPAGLAYLEQADIRHFERLLHETGSHFADRPGVRAAIDVALHDAFTQFLGVRLVDFFGQVHTSLPTSVTIGIKDVKETVEEAREYDGMGFRIVKVKTGKNPELDAERVIRIQEEFPGMIIRVDANQGYSVKDLSAFTRLAARVKLDLIEQPFPADRFVEDIREAGEKDVALVVADETLKNAQDALILVKQAPQCRIFNIKLMKTGGLMEAGNVARIAATAGINLMWGCNDESAVSISAALHKALSCPHTKYLDLDGSLDLIHDVVTGGFRVEEGMMYLTDKPGLGVRRASKDC